MVSSRRSIVALACAVFAIGLGATSAQSKPSEQVHFVDYGFEIVDEFCGDLQVSIEFNDRGHFLVRPTGPDRLPRYSSVHHGDATYTNLATEKAFTFTWNYSNKDVRVTNNGDGTFTALFQIPGPERIYGPDGQLLNTSGGTIRFAATLDYNGTPSDPSDDVFISEEFVTEHGGQPQAPFDFCDAFRTLTG